MPADLIDFGIERSRHEHFFGREHVLAAIDRHLEGSKPSSRWVLVTAGPGMGKSAILSRWLDLEEQRGRLAPHHFLRRDVMDWDRPEAVVRSLSAQIEALYPAQKDPAARPESRLIELLARVSKNELVPRGERLVVVVDGLDEARSEDAGQNPLPDFLPYALPPCVHVLCASRPQYPHLGWLESRGSVRRIDLDAPEWASSNEQACRAFWADQAPRFTPRLDPKLVEEAVARGEGNLLYAVKLRDWLEEQPVEQRRVKRLPRGLSGFLEQIWQQLRSLPREQFGLVANGLGLICAAREALPLEEIEAAWEWNNVGAGEDFLHAARALLLEEPVSWRDARAYRPYHEAFRAFLAEKLGPKRIAELHRRLLETTARWPVAEGESSFRKRYAARHAIAHALAAGEREKARRLSWDLGLLEALCGEVGPAALEEALRLSAKELGDRDIDLLHRAAQAESHWLRNTPEALPELMYYRLRSAGWEEERIKRTAQLPRGLPRFRLRHPVRMWTGVERTLYGHTYELSGCAISPDGQRIVSASLDRTLKVWDLGTGQILSTLRGHSDQVMACAIAPDGQRIVSASDDGALKLWDLTTGQLLWTIRGHSGRISSCVFSPDGERIASTSHDGKLKIWNSAKGQLVSTFRCRQTVNSCAISPDGKRIVAACGNNLKVWDFDAGQRLFTIQGHSGSVNSCAISPDGRRIVSASDDGTLKVWDMATGKALSTVRSNSRRLFTCAISPDGQRALSTSRSTVDVLDLETGQLLFVLQGHSDDVIACVFSPDGQRIVSASDDGTLKVWNLETGRPPSALRGHTDEINACAISPDGQRIASASEDGTLRIWNPTTGRLLSTIEEGDETVRACAFSPDGQRVAYASTASPDRLMIYDPAAGQPLSTLQGHSEWINSCSFSPDGRRFVSASDDRTLKVWDLATGRLLSTLKGHSDSVTFCAISADGRSIASASFNGILKVWDLATGRLLSTLKGHSEGVWACAFSPDGRRIVSASVDETLKVWDVATRQPLLTLRGHIGAVRGCAFSTDCRRIVSASADRTLKIWDATTGACLDTAHGVSPFRCMSLLHDLLCAGDATGNLWMFDLMALDHRKKPLTRASPIRLFFSYSHRDEALRDELEAHLAVLKREGLVQSWHDRHVAAGDTRADEVERNLEEADVILLLVSAHFLASDDCYKEMERALARHDAGQARVIPVILRPSDWNRAPLARLQVLPKDAEPVTQWHDHDAAWTDVVKGIRCAVEALRGRSG
ncbi:WD repeat-containing protein [Sorangium cellulosum]|uniref:WD repeat-containing protein n=1 Tax=Sorangium cellulosum TaxID=56 RepID=A0A2L0EUJ3_SORCE|nr:TIR domain-containing protein [Sorangium cellulosum]AUX42963.1 WD repeat-containing protein [Sorangium cellulosum]